MSQQTLVEFNPYRELLDIPTERQSLTHYRLLGVTAFEDDPAAIDEAVRRRLEQLEPHREGAHSEECRGLEREIEAAAACLKVPSSREVYERELLHSSVMRPAIREELRQKVEADERTTATEPRNSTGPASPTPGPVPISLRTPPDLHQPTARASAGERSPDASDLPLERPAERRFWSGLFEKPAFAYSIGGITAVVLLLVFLGRLLPTAPVTPTDPDPDTPSVAIDTTSPSKDEASGNLAVPPAAKPKTCEMSIEVYPQGAEVLIDDECRGTAPTIVDLTPGKHVIEIKHPGYESKKEIVTVTDKGLELDWALHRIGPPSAPETAWIETFPPPETVQIESPAEPKEGASSAPSENHIVDMPSVAPLPSNVPISTRFATHLPTSARSEIDRILRRLERLPKPSRNSHGLFDLPGLDGASAREPILDYTYALVYYVHDSFDDNRIKAKAHLDAAIDHTTEPFFAPWRLRIWMHLQDEKWEEAIRLCHKLVEKACDSTPVDRTTLDGNVYFVACVVGFIQGVVKRENIAFGQYDAWIYEDLMNIAPALCEEYSVRSNGVEQFTLLLLPTSSQQGLTRGELRNSILIEKYSLPVSPVFLQADLRRALSEGRETRALKLGMSRGW